MYQGNNVGTRCNMTKAMKRVDKYLAALASFTYIIQCRWRQSDNDNPRNKVEWKRLYTVYPRLRAHLSEISAISGLLSYLLIAERRAIIHKRKWLGTTVTHFWRLTRLCRRPSAGSDGTSHLRVEALARAIRHVQEYLQPCNRYLGTTMFASELLRTA